MPAIDKSALLRLKESVQYNQDAPQGAKQLFDLLVDNAGVTVRTIDDENYLAHFVYKPTQIKVASDDGKLSGQSYGKLTLLLSRKNDGQTLAHEEFESLSLVDFENKSNEDLVSEMLTRNGVKAFTRGHPINTESRIAIPYNLSASGQYDKNNYAQKSDTAIKRAGKIYSGTYQKDSLSNTSLKLFLQRAEETFRPLEVDLTNLASTDFYRESGIYRTQWDDIEAALTLFQKQSSIELYQALYGRRNELLVDAGFGKEITDPPNLSDVDMSSVEMKTSNLYSESVLNFIAEGEHPQARKYRKEFVDKTLTLMFGSPELAEEVFHDHQKLNVPGQTVFADIISKRHDTSAPYAQDREIIDMIDQGQYPAKAIAEKMGFTHLGPKQFKRAMALLGQGSHRVVWGASYYGIDNLKNCMALSKVPPEWLSFDGKGNGDVFLDPAMSVLKANENQFKRFMPFLKQAGFALEKCQANGDKSGAKEIAKQWRWLAQNNGKDLQERINDIEAKYKINATWDDYGKLIEGSMKTVWHRTLMDISDFDVVDAVSVYDSQLEVDYDKLTSMLHKHLDEEYISEWEPPEYDEDEFDDFDDVYIPDGPEQEELPSSHLGSVYEMSQTTINAYIKSMTTSFKEVLDKNAEWHVNASKLTKEMNNVSSNPVQWDGLLESPVALSENYTIHSITTRQDLLEEGNEMDHCVFSYLGACLSGESTIMSIRDEHNERVATLELNPNSSDGDDEPVTYSFGQCFGYKNENVSDELRSLVDSFIDKINDQEIKVAPSIGGNEAMASIVDEVEMDPLNKGYILSSVPYHTHAAHLDFFTLEKMLPAGAKVEDLIFKESEANLRIFEISPFSKDISLIRDMAKKHGVAPDNMVRVAIAHDIKKMSELPKLMDGLARVRDVLIAVKSYDLPLTPEQQGIKAQEQLDSEGLPSYTLDVLVEAYASGNPEKSLSMLVMTTNPRDAESVVNNEVGIEQERPDDAVRMRR